MSGARLVTMLVHELRARGARYGLATMCIGVGQGIATIVEAMPEPARRPADGHACHISGLAVGLTRAGAERARLDEPNPPEAMTR